MTTDRSVNRLLVGCAFCCTSALLLASLAISAGYRPSTGEEKPKITDWMQAWGSLAGVVAGLAAALAATALLLFERRQADEVRRQLGEERRAGEESRARAVITAGLSFPHSGRTMGPAGEMRFGSVELAVHNFGADPVHWVVVSVVLPGGRMVEHNGTEFVAPGERNLVVITLRPPHTCVGDNPAFDAKLCEVSVAFTDSSGIRWLRRDNGSPERVPGELLHLRDLIEFSRPETR